MSDFKSPPKPSIESSVQSSDEFEQRAQNLLRASAEQLDGHTRSRLTQARYAALEAAEKRSLTLWPLWHWVVPGSGVAAAAILAVMLVVKPAQFDRDMDVEAQRAAVSLDDLELVASEDNLELYQDMDFYAWLSSSYSEDWMPTEAPENHQGINHPNEIG